MTESIQYIFVYGTLRRGEQRDINRLTPAPRWVGEAYVRGSLYDLGDYPGLRLGEGAGSIQGEVYAIDPALLPVLDQIEGITPNAADEYSRRSLEVTVGTEKYLCWVYEVNPMCLGGKALIASGNWITYRKR